MTALEVLLPGFVGTELPEWVTARLRDGMAGVCLFRANIDSAGQLRRLTDDIRAANPRAIIAIDEEGGDVTRLYQGVGSPYPGNAILGRIDDVAYTEEIAATVGSELRAVGVNLDLAPDVDANSNDANPVIGVRSFGSDAALVARHAAAWVRGLESTGVASSAKHFPGHGDTAQDSHLALPVVDLPLDTLRERELLPFAAAIAAGASTIMTSHILLPQVDADNPATFSPTILEDLLRGELGFTGLIVSDALDMKGASGQFGIPAAAVRALRAGCDLLCIGTDNSDEQVDDIVAAIGAAHIEPRVEDATRRIATLVDRLPGRGAPVSEPRFDLLRTSTAFDWRPGVTIEPHHRLYQFETEANIAVGDAPWGALAAGAEVTLLREGDPIAVRAGSQPILLGRDNHRHDWVRRVIGDVRAQHPSTVVVDVGWPGADRRYADIATFGASRHTSQALLAALDAATMIGTETK